MSKPKTIYPYLIAVSCFMLGAFVAFGLKQNKVPERIKWQLKQNQISCPEVWCTGLGPYKIKAVYIGETHESDYIEFETPKPRHKGANPHQAFLQYVQARGGMNKLFPWLPKGEVSVNLYKMAGNRWKYSVPKPGPAHTVRKDCGVCDVNLKFELRDLLNEMWEDWIEELNGE